MNSFGTPYLLDLSLIDFPPTRQKYACQDLLTVKFTECGLIKLKADCMNPWDYPLLMLSGPTQYILWSTDPDRHIFTLSGGGGNIYWEWLHCWKYLTISVGPVVPEISLRRGRSRMGHIMSQTGRPIWDVPDRTSCPRQDVLIRTSRIGGPILDVPSGAWCPVWDIICPILLLPLRISQSRGARKNKMKMFIIWSGLIDCYWWKNGPKDQVTVA